MEAPIGGFVTQTEEKNCFSACVAMLTGLPIEALPTHGPGFRASGLMDRDGSITFHITGEDEEILADWNEALAGEFRIDVAETQPDGWSIAALVYGEYLGRQFVAFGHAIVAKDDDRFDPAPSEEARQQRLGWPEYRYYTVTPLQG